MLLAYLDESYTIHRYYLAALLVPASEANSLTSALDGVVADAAASHPEVAPTAELHGYDLVAGKRDWQGLAGKVRARIGIYDQALRAIGTHPVKVIVRGVDVAGLRRRYVRPDHPHSVALSHLIERIDECAEADGELALMIADEVAGQDAYRRNLWQYQRSGTTGYRARRINCVIDTIHFAPSSSSRLVQAADLIAYLVRRQATHVETDERARRANLKLWSRIEPLVWHSHCWWPS